MRLALWTATLLLASAPAFADARVERIDILDAGIYEIQTGKKTAEASAPTGEVTDVPTSANVEATTEIKGRLGLEFGFRYRIVGEPAGAEVPLDFAILYPEPGLRAPADGQSITESRYTLAKKIGEPVHFGYGFENEWEIVPGTWTFQIWYQARKLAEQSFTVVQ